MSQDSSTTTQSSAGTSGWGDSPWIAFAIRVLVFAVPVLLSLFVTWALAQAWEAPTTIPAAVVRLILLAIVAVVVGAAADRSAKRFLPLAALFRLSLVFPDQAPSRFAVALRSGNTRRIQQRLAEVESGGFRGDEADAALLVVELAAALSEHDRLTRGHSERVRAFTALIADEMGLSDEDSNKLQWAGLIHDVGKLRIPQEILTKPGRLTAEEFEVIKTHPAEGLRIAEPLAGFLGPWIGAVGEHHERFDGGGYPNGLAGTDISLAGRIVAVADAYDVITAARSYKKPLSPEFARRELADNAGNQFDPVVVRAFLNISLGRLRRAMWPLSWAVQVPFLGTAITTPVAQTIAATAVTLATATGVTVATGGFDAIDAPEAIAMVEADEEFESDSLPASPDSSAVSAEDSGPGTTTAIVARDAAPPETESDEVSPDDATTTTPPTTMATPSSSTAPDTTVVPTSTTTTTTTTAAPLTDCQRAQGGDTSLAGADLNRCDLSDLTLTGATFDGADVSGANLTDTKLIGGSFVGTNFDDVLLTNGEIRDADLRETTWVGAEVTFSGMDNVNLTAADFRSATITDTGIDGNLTNALFDGATISRAGFDGSTMPNTSFNAAEISQASFTAAALGQSDFRSTVLVEVTFETAQMANARFANSNMTDVSFVSGNLTGANFAPANIADSNFYAATISGASFAGTNFSNMNMVDVIGVGTNFSQARLDGGSMVSAQLREAIFTDAQILAWDLNGAVLTNAQFTRASFATSSFQSVDASNAVFRSADFGAGGLWLFNATLTSADFTSAIGTPNEPATANYNNTTCPNGAVQSAPCW